MFTIGEFSRVSGLTIKTLRFYDAEGVLRPAWVDPVTGYRYYNEVSRERARIVAQLRALEFPVAQIRQILESVQDDADLLERLTEHKMKIQESLERQRELADKLQFIIRYEQEARGKMETGQTEVVVRDVPAQLIAGIRIRGKYSDCGRLFGQLGRTLGRRLSSPPFCLYYDGEYKETDADLEACFPVKPGPDVDGIAIRELPAARCATLLHRGAYEDLGRSYGVVFSWLHDQGFEAQLPTREVYLKGPGMIFKGNPRNYLTEIQIPIA